MKKLFVIGSFTLFGLMVMLAVISAASEPVGALSREEVCQAARATVSDVLPQPLDWEGNCLTGEGVQITQNDTSWVVRSAATTPEGRKEWEVAISDRGDHRFWPTVNWVH